MAPEGDQHDAFDWDGTPAPQAPGLPGDLGATLTPLAAAKHRSWPRLAALGVGAAVVGGGLAVVLSSGGGSAAGQGGAVALAASVTNREPGFKFEMTINAAADGQSAGITASGSINTGPPPSGTMDATVAGAAITERIIGTDVYVQTTGTGGQWLHVSVPAIPGQSVSGGSSTQLTAADPAQTLDYLRAAGTVTDDGPATISGVATTHYHAEINLSTYASMLPAAQQAAAQQAAQAYEQATGSSTLPIDVWVDGSNLVREMQMDVSVAGGGDLSIVMNFYDYGPQPAVSAPPAGDVLETPGAQTPPASTQTPSTPPASSQSNGSSGTPAPD